MTFGKIKSIIEQNLIESYKNENEFKKYLREFKHNVLTDKSMSKLYSLYDQLSKPQGLSESDAKDYLQEGILLIQHILPKVKLPKTLNEGIGNNYEDIDVLVYSSKTDISERVNAKKNIINVLMSQKDSIKETVNLPIKSMVSIANKTLNNYIETLDENSKKEFLQIISEDIEVLKSKFEIIKESAISKLQTLLENEEELETKTKISETIERLKIEEFDQLNFVKIKSLEESI